MKKFVKIMAVLSIVFLAFACTPKNEVKDDASKTDSTLVVDSTATSSDTVVSE